MVTCPPAKLRLIHYPFDASVEDVPGIGAHTDYECFTLLLADQPGLEVLNEESGGSMHLPSRTPPEKRRS